MKKVPSPESFRRLASKKVFTSSFKPLYLLPMIPPLLVRIEVLAVELVRVFMYSFESASLQTGSRL